MVTAVVEDRHTNYWLQNLQLIDYYVGLVPEAICCCVVMEMLVAGDI